MTTNNPDRKKTTFYKYHGTGNDFIIIRQDYFPVWMNKSWISAICDRHFGIGADGMILILPSEKTDFRMLYFNADGLEGSMCGNGGRCAAAFAFNQGIAQKAMHFEAFDGLHEAVILSQSGQSTMVSLQLSDVQSWQHTSDALLINTGSPHLVQRVDNLHELDVVVEGRKIRYNKAIAENGINANFFQIKDGLIELRTYERGVEAETLSCGTGVTAAAIAASLWYGGNSFEISMPGGRLKVQFNVGTNSFTEIRLEGPATFVFEGVL